MSVNPLVAAIARHFTRVRTGLDIGFTDAALVNELHSVRGGNWESVSISEELPYADDQFDIVVLDEAAFRPMVVREVNRVLKSGGRLLFTFRRHDGFGLPELYRNLRGGFDLTEVRRESWWICRSFRGPLTVFATKKAWKEPNSFGRSVGSPFLSVLLAALTCLVVIQRASAEESEVIRLLLNSRASGSVRDYKKAAEIVARDAEAGHLLERYLIALVSRESSAPEAARLTPAQREEYFSSAREKIRLFAEEKNNPLAWYLLSLETNDDELLKRAVDGGNPQALNVWGTAKLIKALRDASLLEEDCRKECQTCFECFKKAAAQGDSNGYYNLGMCHQNGYGTEKNINLAFDCFVKAAQAGHVEAINNLGGFYREGLVVKRSYETAAKWFLRSAEQGNSFGQLNYALALQRGEGVEKNLKRAFEYFGLAAVQGNADAMNAYGMCFYTGNGVAASDAVAVLWFRNAAACGCAAAMDNLSVCARLGRGMARSEEDATVWMVRARAARGDANADAWLRQNGHLK